MKTLSEVLAVLFALAEDEFKKATDDDKSKVAKIFGLSTTKEEKSDATLSTKVTTLETAVGKQKDQIDLLLAENKAKGEKLAEVSTKLAVKEMTETIDKALSEGRITPKTKEKWEAMFKKDPEGTKALLAEQPPVIDLTTHGHGHEGDQEKNWTASEKASAKKAGLTDEDIKKHGPKE